MPILRTGAGDEVEYLLTGSGPPVTVFAHGLGASITQTRPLGGGVPGTRVFLHFRGHGRSSADGPWSYAALADELRAVADVAGATRALGVSMGAGALCRLLADTPDRFDRLVFLLPAVLDRARGPATLARLEALLDAVGSSRPEVLEAEVRRELPGDVRDRPGAQDYVRDRAATLRSPDIVAALRATRTAVAVPDRATLARVTAPALVLAAAGDPLHPVPVARELAAALPHAELHVYPGPAVLWTHRADLRARVSGFLGAAAQACGQGG